LLGTRASACAAARFGWQSAHRVTRAPRGLSSEPTARDG
jgi:hypothetical protein